MLKRFTMKNKNPEIKNWSNDSGNLTESLVNFYDFEMTWAIETRNVS